MAGSSRPLARTSRSWIYPVSRTEREEARDDSRITLAYHWTSSWRRETRPARWIEMAGIVGVFALLLLGWTDGCCLVCTTEVGGSRRLIVLASWLVEVLRLVGASDIFLYIVRNSVLLKISKRYLRVKRLKVSACIFCCFRVELNWWFCSADGWSKEGSFRGTTLWCAAQSRWKDVSDIVTCFKKFYFVENKEAFKYFFKWY